MSQKPQQTGTSDVIKVRYEKLDALKEAGRDPFVITTSARDVLTETIKNNFEEYENKDVCVAGRLLSKRGKGKVSFMDLWDRSGKIQIFAKFDDLGEEEYGFLKKWDIGDIVEVKGFVFKTQMGEISVHAKEVKLLSKSLKPLPEKYHGLTNTDLRYRQRYVDLIMNPEVKDTFVKRSKIIGSIRRYLDNQGFMEVETPMLVANAGGASARPFLTHFNALDEDLKLRISLELYLKRLIVGGLENRSKVIKPSEKKAIAYHEAGHATVSWLLQHAHPLLKVTIVPRGKALGAAWYLPQERQITTKDQLLDQMCSVLGGRAAEEIVFGEISTGAQNDLERATKQAYAMVSIYGMSDKVGMLSYYDSTGQSDFSFTKPYSEKTAELIDAEVKDMVSAAYERAKQLLSDHREQHRQVAELLIEREVIFSDDLENILGKRPWTEEEEIQQPEEL